MLFDLISAAGILGLLLAGCDLQKVVIFLLGMLLIRSWRWRS